MLLFRPKVSSVRSHSRMLLGTEWQRAERSLASKRRRLKEDDIVDSTTEDVKPKQVMRRAQIRGPGRPRGVSVHQRISRFPQLSSDSDVASSFELTAEKADEVHIESDQPSAASSAEDTNHQYIMNGGHDYFQTLNDDESAERWTAIKADSAGSRPLNLFNHARSSDDEYFAGSEVDPFCVNGASPSHASDLLLSRVESDHAYAKRAPEPEELRESMRPVDDGGDSVLACLTVLNAQLSCQPPGPSIRCHTPSLPCIQKCTVTLNKLDDAIFAQQPRIKFQLRHFKQCRAFDEHSRLEDFDGCRDICRAAFNGCLSSSSGSASSATVSHDVSGSSSVIVRPGDSMIPVPACGDWTPASASSHNSSGLDLLASVSSLTADRLHGTLPLVNTTSRPADGALYDSAVSASHEAMSDNACHPTSRLSSKQRVKVFCIKKKCSDGSSRSEYNGPTSAQLLDVVRDFVAKGSSGPLCGTFPGRLTAYSARCGQVSCSRQSEEIACNSLLFLHNSHSPLCNGLTERH